MKVAVVNSQALEECACESGVLRCIHHRQLSICALKHRSCIVCRIFHSRVSSPSRPASSAVGLIPPRSPHATSKKTSGSTSSPCCPSPVHDLGRYSVSDHQHAVDRYEECAAVHRVSSVPASTVSALSIDIEECQYDWSADGDCMGRRCIQPSALHSSKSRGGHVLVHAGGGAPDKVLVGGLLWGEFVPAIVSGLLLIGVRQPWPHCLAE